MTYGECRCLKDGTNHLLDHSIFGPFGILAAKYSINNKQTLALLKTLYLGFLLFDYEKTQ